ncbi:hypothetical protein [Halolamina pelagica]|uniref:hypothetical protein n=1 Tax=Halolamina pelagica TaxID=699431 RepID=UPI001EFBE8AD|nr:hypothetical protein [Halolamina pelagica]
MLVGDGGVLADVALHRVHVGEQHRRLEVVDGLTESGAHLVAGPGGHAEKPGRRREKLPGSGDSLP